jgi:hypothetical protein
MHSENNDVTLGRLLLRAGMSGGAEIGDTISQCRRPSGIRYNYSVTSAGFVIFLLVRLED